MQSQTDEARKQGALHDRTIRRALAAAVAAAAPGAVEAAILFGSRARGDARPDSDWDVLVLLKDDQDLPTRRMAIRRALFDAGWDHGARVGPVVMRWSDIHDHVGLMRNVAGEGVAL